MQRILCIAIVAVTWFIAPPGIAADRETRTFKQVAGVKLELDIYTPSDHAPSNSRAAVVLFFGGGWLKGGKGHLAPQAEYFADRGMVAITPLYRTIQRHGATIFDCVRDARSAMRWVRAHAAELGIDPNRIAAGGASSGGHLALCTTLLEGPENDDEDLDVSCAANAFVLLNPTVDTETLPPVFNVGDKGPTISPQHHIRSNLPPSILFHGTEDKSVPFRTVETFSRDMQAAGNDMRLVAYKDLGHGFFNKGNYDDKYYLETLEKADAFLVELGYLKPN